MANDLTKQPWIIDTAAATVLATARLRVKQIRWVGATTAGHEAIVSDAAARVRWRSLATGANFVDKTYPDADIEGLVVPTLASGLLYIWLG